MRFKLCISMFTLLSAAVGMFSCSQIEEGDCKVSYINYQYLNNIGKDATEQIYKMTDFIFTKDSVLYRVDDNIMNGKMRKRPLNLPDGEWIVITYGNLYAGSKVDYVIAHTRMAEMMTKVIKTPTYKGSYATRADAPSLQLGDSDKLYFGKVNLKVSKGYTDQIYTVNMSNVHIWLGAVVRWKDIAKSPTKANSNLHIRLEYVPVEHSFIHDMKMDGIYGIPFLTPRITTELASQLSPLRSNTNASDGEFYFDTYGLRWETGKAPILRIYDGESLLINKDLDLNKYFSDQRINLTDTRVQFFQLLIVVDSEIVTISALGIDDWEDGGPIQ